ncbi:MAG TPA: septum formation initiator family protein [Streptomyces sp.]|jgi:cell division protein FtsB|nr:septum formation initiator family protein [Streptomyces sp.]
MRRQRSDASADRFSTATRLRALGSQAAERVYRSKSRRVRGPRRSRLTGRAALLALVLCSLVVALAYPMRQYVAQRLQIADQRQELQQRQDRVGELREQKARWQDDAYVRQQARKRLHFLFPGETGYQMRGPSSGHARAARPPESEPEQQESWYGSMWRTLDTADQAAQGARSDRAGGHVGSR